MCQLLRRYRVRHRCSLIGKRARTLAAPSDGGSTGERTRPNERVAPAARQNKRRVVIAATHRPP
jgi:hypothetical protein